MKSVSCIHSTSRLFLFGVVFLFSFGVLSPLPVVAGGYLRIDMPIIDGDPGDGWSFAEGGGNGHLIIPPEEGENFFLPRDPNYIEVIQLFFGGHQVVLYGLRPYFGGQSLGWPLTFIGIPMLGGEK